MRTDLTNATVVGQSQSQVAVRVGSQFYITTK